MNKIKQKNYLKTKVLLSLISFMFTVAPIAQATEIKSITEFFSFNCTHCASVNPVLDQYVDSHNIEFLSINIDNNPNVLATDIMYYVAIDAGIGKQFKQGYFNAVSAGMVAYTPETLSYVTQQVQNSTMKRLLRSKTEREKIKQKINYVDELRHKYNVQVTPTFLINQTTVLEGEDVIRSLIGGDNG